MISYDFGATLLIIVVLTMMVGAGFLVLFAPCDPHLQRCLDHQQGPLQPGKQFI